MTDAPTLARRTPAPTAPAVTAQPSPLAEPSSAPSEQPSVAPTGVPAVLRVVIYMELDGNIAELQQGLATSSLRETIASLVNLDATSFELQVIAGSVIVRVVISSDNQQLPALVSAFISRAEVGEFDDDFGPYKLLRIGTSSEATPSLTIPPLRRLATRPPLSAADTQQPAEKSATTLYASLGAGSPSRRAGDLRSPALVGWSATAYTVPLQPKER